VIERLLAGPRTRDRGAALAREACHLWRAAPVRLVPALVRRQCASPSEALAAALTTASISAEATRVHAALLATVPFTPCSRPVPHPAGPGRPSYDGVTAAGRLAALPVGVRRLDHAVELFGALLDAGPLTFRQAAQLYNLTFRRPGRTQADCAHLWLRHAGPQAAPRLLAELTPHLGCYVFGRHHLRGLAAMGRSARPALPAVTALIDRRTRLPVNDSTRDAEIRIDEDLLAEARAARRAILDVPQDHTSRPDMISTTGPAGPRAD
jgi:hypothetical protein